MVMGKWDRGIPALHFGWLEYQQYPFMRVRFGQFKEPYSLEGVNSDQYFDFNERSLWVANLLQLEDLGVMVHGKLWAQRLEYGLGVFNGRGANQDDTNDQKEIVGQLTLVPFRGLDSPWWKGLHLSVSGADSKMEDDLKTASFKTAARTTFWAFASTVTPQGHKTRTSAEIEWYMGPGSLKGGVHRVALNTLQLGALEKDLAIGGWVVSGNYVLTGENKPRNKPVIPAAEFNPAKHGWGAIEVNVRYEQFRGPRDLFEQGFFTGTPAVVSWTTGFNWHLNRHMKSLVHYQDTRFDDPIDVLGEKIDSEKTLTFRIQFEI
jgi:phosphate-selective porin OprO/OprP